MNRHEIRNNITEHTRSYSLCCIDLLRCYSGLKSSKSGQLCGVIFSDIIYNKINVKGESQSSSPESRRIYNKKLVNAKTLLEELNPSKYNIEGKDINRDVGNMSRQVKQLHEQNIFYVWRMGHPQVFMFFLERDPGIWKEYNSKATIPPKTIWKLANVSFDAALAMEKILIENGTPEEKIDIKRSYAAFLDELIGKMPSSCQKLTPKLSNYRKFSEYIRDVKNALSKMGNFMDFEIDEDFIFKMPLSFRNNYLKAIVDIEGDDESSEEEKQMNTLEREKLEALLIPKNKNLVSDSTNKKTSKKKSNLKLKKQSFAKEMNIFKNCNDMTRFYQAQFKQVHPQAIFQGFATERQETLNLMDLLIKKGKSEDKQFLRSWIRHYATKQTPNAAKNPNKTSIKSFSKTIDEYLNLYIG